MFGKTEMAAEGEEAVAAAVAKRDPFSDTKAATRRVLPFLSAALNIAECLQTEKYSYLFI